MSTTRTREQVEKAFKTLDRTVRRKLNHNGDYPTREELHQREELRKELRNLTVKSLDSRKDLKAITQALFEQEKRRGTKETPDRPSGEQDTSATDGA